MAKKDAGTNPTIRFAKVTIDETEYSLAYSYGAIAKAEKLTGCNLLLGMVNISDLSDTGFPAANVVLGLFWSALSVAHPHMTMNDAAVLIRPDTIGSVIDAYREAQNLSSKDYKPAEKKSVAEPDANQN